MAPARQRIVWAHLILGLVAAVSWLLRSNIWHLNYWRDYGFILVSYVLLATLPYVTSAILSWRLAFANRWRPWAYVGILIVGTAFGLVNNSGIWMVQPGVLGASLVLMIQFIGFILAAEWALEGNRVTLLEAAIAAKSNDLDRALRIDQSVRRSIEPKSGIEANREPFWLLQRSRVQTGDDLAALGRARDAREQWEAIAKSLSGPMERYEPKLLVVLAAADLRLAREAEAAAITQRLARLSHRSDEN